MQVKLMVCNEWKEKNSMNLLRLPIRPTRDVKKGVNDKVNH